MLKKACKYFKKNPSCNAITHVLLGMGLGILVTYPFVKTHPLRWAAFLIGAGLIGYGYACWSKK